MKLDYVPRPRPESTGPMGHSVCACKAHKRPSSLCGHSSTYLGYAVAGVEEDGRVGVHKAIFEGEELLSHGIPVVPGEACGQEGAWRRAEDHLAT